jgi:hypothetical protein
LNLANENALMARGLAAKGKAAARRGDQMSLSTRVTIVISTFLALLASGCDDTPRPDPETAEMQKAFDREGVLVKTCATHSGSATGGSVSVYRFRNELWFRDGPNRLLRRVEASLENVCDVLHPPRGSGPS